MAQAMDTAAILKAIAARGEATGRVLKDASYICRTAPNRVSGHIAETLWRWPLRAPA